MKLLVFGAGGLARHVKHIINSVYEPIVVVAFVDLVKGPPIGNIPVISEQEAPLDIPGLLAVGDGRVRAQLGSGSFGKVFWENEPPNVIHPRACVQESSVVLGLGNIIMAGALFSCDIEIGNHCVINLGVTIGHDVTLRDYVVVNPGANISGGATLGKGCLVGTGSQVLEGVSIGEFARVGAGAVVTQDVAPGETVIGIPATTNFHGSVSDLPIRTGGSND
jgi:sugar O-acyltransferase (sialic acid O-acetyltransferase NeuD family)